MTRFSNPVSTSPPLRYQARHCIGRWQNRNLGNIVIKASLTTDMEELIHSLLELVGRTPPAGVAGDYPPELSGGQRQRSMHWRSSYHDVCASQMVEGAESAELMQPLPKPKSNILPDMDLQNIHGGSIPESFI